jgi:peptidoglycan/xylan/chitin deacetylase (PgdA/CDA1 family)
MCRLRIGNKYGVRHVDIVIEDDEDGKKILEILAKNGIPATFYGEVKNGNQDND